MTRASAYTNATKAELLAAVDKTWWDRKSEDNPHVPGSIWTDVYGRINVCSCGLIEDTSDAIWVHIDKVAPISDSKNLEHMIDELDVEIANITETLDDLTERFARMREDRKRLSTVIAALTAAEGPQLDV